MEERIRKPRVFLSHSKKDISFINKLENDLRQCQIDTWLDDMEIRHGKPWLNAIFQEGIPSCDTVLVYLTESSIESPMVQKEIDVSIITQLDDSGVAFLPYVNDACNRDKLRSDLRAIQIPEWNQSNYADVFPRVVAEIWRSYCERIVPAAIQAEKIKRMELELTVEKYRQNNEGNIFSPVEDKDFSYIWDSLNRYVKIIFRSQVDFVKQLDSSGESKKKIDEAEIKASFNLGQLVAALVDRGYNECETWTLEYELRESSKRTLDERLGGSKPDRIWTVEGVPYIEPVLLMYGLLQNITVQKAKRHGGVTYHGLKREPATYVAESETKTMLSERFYRFRYWLAVNGKLSDELVLRFE